MVAVAGAYTANMPAAVHLVLRDADHSGIVVATRDNWTGVAYALPADDFARLPIALDKPGVYVLLGADESDTDSFPVVYIGEAETVTKRLRHGHAQLARADITWRRVIIFTTQSNDLHKGHVRWLEGALVKQARKVSRVKLTNSDSNVTTPSLPEQDMIFVETFLYNMLLLFPLLGVDAFVQAANYTESDSEPNLHSVLLSLTLEGEVKARGRLTDTGFTLYAESMLKDAHTGSFSPSALRQWSILEDNGQLDIAVNGYRKLLTTVSVNSSSLAAVLVTGRSASGPNSWRSESGKTLREILG